MSRPEVVREETVGRGLLSTGASADAPPRRVPSPPRAFQPLSPARYKVQFTAGAELRAKLERLQALLRSEVPDGDLSVVVEKAVDVMLERIEARKFGWTRSPRRKARPSDPSSRDVQAAVQREVYERDGGQCRFVDEDGRRCPERHSLEYHHQHAFARGGGKGPDNICLMCGPHNRYLAELEYGREVMSRYWKVRRRLGATLSGENSSVAIGNPQSEAHSELGDSAATGRTDDLAGSS
jgi:hypothetical protein